MGYHTPSISRSDDSITVYFLFFSHENPAMNHSPEWILLIESIEKVEKAYALLKASLEHLSHENIDLYRTAEDQEPLDAFIIRLERFVELILSKLAKSISLYEQTAYDGTVRDRLLLLERLEIIDSVEEWIEIRNTRNKIVHDYLENISVELYLKTQTEYKKHFDFFWDGLQKYRNLRWF